MKAVTRLTSLMLGLGLSLGLSLVATSTMAQTTTYNWSDIDCSQSRIASWPGLKCKATNVVTSEGNIGSFRRWAAFGTTSEGYVHIFVWEAVNSFSYITTEDTTAEFLKWMYENGRSASDFSPVGRYHNADYSSFHDNQRACFGFRRTGNPQRGGYDRIVAGILCAPPGRSLSSDQVAQFIDRVQIR